MSVKNVKNEKNQYKGQGHQIKVEVIKLKHWSSN